LARTDPTDNLSAPSPYIKAIGIKTFKFGHVIPLKDVYAKEGENLELTVETITPKGEDGNIEIFSPEGNLIAACNLKNGGIIGISEINKECNVSFVPSQEGFYKFSLIVNNKEIKSKYLYIYLTSEDKIPPIITLKGDNPLYLEVGSSYKEPGYSATDNLDGDITDRVSVDYKNLDTDVEGEYKIIYSVKDTAGNETTAERTVIVQEKHNNPPQIIEITPDTTINSGEGIKLYTKVKDPDGDNVITYWKFGDNIIKQCQSEECSIFVTPEETKTYEVIVEDNKGAKTTQSVVITVKDVKKPELKLNATLSTTNISLVEGEKTSISLNLSTVSNSTVQIEVNSSDKGKNTILVYAKGTTSTGTEITASQSLEFYVNVSERNYTLSFINETYPDGTNLNINEGITSIDKKWTLKMSDTHSATLVLEKDTSKECNLNINGSLPTISVSPSETFDVNIKFNMPTSVGNYQCYFKIKDTNGNYYKIGNSNNIWVKIEITANDLTAFINTNTKETTVNTPVNLIVNIQNGNPPYELTVNWGDGTTADTRTFTDKGDYFLSHTYTSEGNYTIEGYIVDKAGKTYSTTINVKVSSQVDTITSWIGKLTKVYDIPVESNIDITVTPKTTQEGYTYYEYSLNVIPDATVYYKGFILPVPQGILDLNQGNVKFTFLMQSGEIKYYDREMWISTDKKKIGVIPIDIGYYNELQSQEGYGKVIIKDFTSNTSQTLYKNVLNDSYGANAGSRYSIELTNDSLTVYRYNSAQKQDEKLFTEYTPTGNYITEINLNFRGNGKLLLAVVEYDIDKDGRYDKKLILNTQDKTVDWSSLANNNQNNKPVINSFTADKTTADVGDTITFSYDVSDSDGDSLTCEFDFDGDGNIDKTVENCSKGSVSYTYQINGNFTVEMKVSDSIDISSVFLNISIGQNSNGGQTVSIENCIRRTLGISDTEPLTDEKLLTIKI